MENNDHIDKHIKKSLGDLTVQPRYSSFDEVMQKLRKKKRRRFFFILLLPGLLMLSGFATWYFVPEKQNDIVTKFEKDKSLIKTTEPRVIQKHSDNYQNGPPTDVGEQKNNLVNKKEPDQEEKKNISETKETDLTNVRSIKHSIPNPVAIGLPQKNQKEHFINTSANGAPTAKQDHNNFTQTEDDAGIAQTSVPAFSETSALELGNKTDSAVKPELLEPVSLLLPYDKGLQEAKTVFNESGYNEVKKKENKDVPKFFMALSLEPQFSAYFFTKKKNIKANETFQEAYFKYKWDNNKLRLNYSIGIKVGLAVAEKWEFQGGLGYQQFMYYEKLMPSTPVSTYNTIQNDPRRGFVWNTQEAVDYKYRNFFSYYWCTAEAAKYFTFLNFIKMKAGAGIRMNYLLNGYAIYADADGVYTYVGGRGYITSWLTSVNFKLGYVEDLGKRLQLQICPNLFCTPNSMFKKYSILGQRSVGAGLEFLLLYKFN